MGLNIGINKIYFILFVWKTYLLVHIIFEILIEHYYKKNTEKDWRYYSENFWYFILLN